MKTPLMRIFLVAMAFSLAHVPAWAQDEDVMFQAFDWNVQNQPPGQTWYDVVSQNRNIISDAGIDVIWMPPPSNSAAPQGYLPRELNDLNSAYGTETQLRNLISQYHQLGIRVLSDIVINHRVGSPDAVTFLNPEWPTFYITADDEGRDFVDFPVEFSINPDFFPGTALKADGSNGGFAAARDLDHRNPAVRADIIQWMLFLKNDIGFDGWRYDFVHGYDPIYNKEYNDATDPYFAVGELLESSRVQTNNWVNFTQQSSSAFDFNTKVALQNAIRQNNLSFLRDGNGQPSGMIGVNPTKSVTFLDNHDTGEAQQCCGSNFIFPGGETNLRKGYAYIMTHPGNPMVFWTHFFDAGLGVRNAITDLVAIRKSARLHSGSTINIVEARNDLYAAYIDGRSGTVAMKLGAADWSPNGSGWVLRTSGNDYAVWTQGGGGPVETVPPFTVNFQRPSGWGSNINAYFFDAASNAMLPGTNAWPGQSMTNLPGSQWYAFTVTPPPGVSASDVRVIFNDGTQQTGDLSRSTDGWFSSGAWSDNCPQDCPGGSPSNQVTLNLLPPGSGWGSTSNIYLFNTVTNGALAGTSGWPGAVMSDISGSSWDTFTFTVPSGVSSNDIGVVFNNGSGQQTVDLTRGTDGWFRVTGTSGGQSTGVWSSNCTTACPPGAGARTSSVADNSLLENDGEILHGVSFFPNPITEQSLLVIKTGKAGSLRVTLTNLQGQTDVIYHQETRAGNHEISVNQQVLGAKGMYLAQVYLNGKRIGELKLLMNE